MQISPSALEPTPGGYQSGRIGPPSGPSEPSAPAGPPRRRKARFGSLLLLATVVAVAGSAGVLATAKRTVDQIDRVEGLEGAFSPSDSNVENFLLVGSDSRADADPNDPDYGSIGPELGSNRSDTIIVLRRDKRGGPAALLSLPRDLWVEIPGRGSQRINVAYQGGPTQLIETVKGLGIPVHHYIEVDFQGFKQLVDALGGVEIGFWNPARDTHTGFYVAEGGLQLLDGVNALAYARSRYYEEYVNDVWIPDNRSDFGRIERQQYFINAALTAAIAQVKTNPLTAGDVLASMTGAIKIDSDLDVLAAAGALREAVADGLQTFTPPVRGESIDGNAVLLLTDSAQPYLDYFGGASNTPPLPA